MKKHILGLVVFSFIVGAAAIFYAVFNVSEIVSISALQYVPAQRTHCKMGRGTQGSELGLSVIRQSTLASGSGLFIFEIDCVASSKQMSLYFYERNEKGTHLIATEVINLKPSLNCEKTVSLYKNFAWAEKVNRGSNIYVVARTSNNGAKFSTNFDESLAVPVLMVDTGNKLIID